MSAEERQARGGRDRAKLARASERRRRVLEERATMLETKGTAMVTKKGQKLDQVYAGLKVLDAAEKLWARLDRLSGGGTASPPAASNGGPETLEDYSRRRPRRG